MRYYYRDHVVSNEHAPGALAILEEGDASETILALVATAEDATALIDEVLADREQVVELVVHP